MKLSQVIGLTSTILMACSLFISAHAFANTPIFQQANPLTVNANDERQRTVTLTQGFDLSATSSFELNLFDDLVLTAVQDQFTLREQGNFSWIGHAEGYEISQVLFVKMNGKLSAQINLGTEQFTLRHVEGDQYLVKEVKPLDELQEAEPILVSSPAGFARSFAAPMQVESGPSTIDLMVVYTKQAALKTGDIDADIQIAVDMMNKMLADSQIELTINLVFSYQTQYAENVAECEKSSPVLYALKDKQDGVMDNVHSYREQYQADLVSLWLDDACDAGGIAFQIVNHHSTAEQWGFSITDADYAVNHMTFMHEIGHNLSSAHDRYVDPDYQGHAIGYSDPVNKFRTVMAYTNECRDLGFECPRIPHFSNPKVGYEYAAGLFANTGVLIDEPDAADNGSAFNETRYKVAAFRDASFCDETQLTTVLPNYLANGRYVVGQTAVLKAEVKACKEPAINADVTVLVNGTDLVQLVDDGSHYDGLANDGVYGATWSAQSAGEFTFEYNAATATQAAGARFDNTVVELENTDNEIEITSITASATHADFIIDRVIDYANGGFWAAGHSAQETVEFTFAKKMLVTQLDVVWHSSYAMAYQIEAYIDGAWLPVTDVKPTNAYSTSEAINLQAASDKMRFVFTKPHNYFYALIELRAKGQVLSENLAPSVNIVYPANNITINEGNNSLSLVANAIDAEDGNIANRISWSSNLQGYLGTGQQLDNVVFLAGSHLITASVTDNDGESATSAITVNVEAAVNTLPRLTITSPNSAITVTETELVTFSADAFDDEDGVISRFIVWSSDLDGVIGNGANIAVLLSVGEHWVKAEITDSRDATVAKLVKVTVKADDTQPTVPAWSSSAVYTKGDQVSYNGAIYEAKWWTQGNVPSALGPWKTVQVSAGNAPVVNIVYPANNITLTVGNNSLSLVADATDVEDGDLASSIVWSSNLQGYLGTGAQLDNVALTVGSHVITAAVTDSDGETANRFITVNVEPAPNTLPTVEIALPAAAISVLAGESVSFSADAFDAEDGTISNFIVWSSDLDGVLGNGANIAAVLSLGEHWVTATITDSNGATATKRVKVTVVADANGNAPSVTIIYPANNITLTVGNNSLSLVANAADTEDGNLDNSVVWTSNLQGNLGTGAQLDNVALTLGTHVITASVTDSDGETATSVITVNIEATPNTAPTLDIASPSNAITVEDGESVSFSADAFDAEDGTISNFIVWSSDVDGALGEGANITAILSVGEHWVSATITDSNGATVAKQVKVTVTGDEPAYPLWSSSKAYAKGEQVTYSGSVYQAKWWTKGEEPGASDWGPWSYVSGRH